MWEGAPTCARAARASSSDVCVTRHRSDCRRTSARASPNSAVHLASLDMASLRARTNSYGNAHTHKTQNDHRKRMK